VQELAGAVHQHTLREIAVGVGDQVSTEGLALAISQDRPVCRGEAGRGSTIQRVSDPKCLSLLVCIQNAALLELLNAVSAPHEVHTE
jgi:hypothetical protein